MVRSKIAHSEWIARALLLLILVRGCGGTVWFSTFITNHRKHFANDFPAFLHVLINNNGRESKHEGAATWASHVEHRHTGQSGLRPLLALTEPRMQRGFLELPRTWSNYIKKLMLNKGANLMSGDLISM